MDLLLSHSGAASGSDSQYGDADRHLLGCEDCQQQLAFLRQSLGDFRDATSAYASAIAPRIPLAPITLRDPQLAAKPPQRLGRRFGFALTGAFAALALAAGLGPSLLRRPQPPIPTVTRAGSGRTAAAPGESDAELLQSIDQDLANSVPPSLAPLQVSEGAVSAKAKQGL
jgi:hypothetical protein